MKDDVGKKSDRTKEGWGDKALGWSGERLQMDMF